MIHWLRLAAVEASLSLLVEWSFQSHAHFFQGVDYFIKVIIGTGGPAAKFVQPANFWKRLATTNFSGETSPSQGAPDDGGNFLVEPAA